MGISSCFREMDKYFRICRREEIEVQATTLIAACLNVESFVLQSLSEVFVHPLGYLWSVRLFICCCVCLFGCLLIRVSLCFFGWLAGCLFLCVLCACLFFGTF